MEPRTLKRWLIAIAVIYFLLVPDLIPDVAGLFGRLDDLGVIALLVWFYRKWVGNAPTQEKREKAVPAPASSPALDPYEVLGVPASASVEEIRSAYKARMSEYHPDKVMHLGKEMQELAHRKSLEIQQAYRQLRR